MELKISGTLGGQLAIPPSKSVAHRMLICAALAGEASSFTCGEYGDDVQRTADCLSALGATVKYSDDSFRIWPISDVVRRCTLDCGESGSTLRFLLPVTAVLGADASFTGAGRLSQRPLSPLYEEMSGHGVKMTAQGSFPLSLNGRLEGGDYTLDGGVSSQFISGLLMALPLAEKDSTLTLTGNVQSKSYIELTVRAMRHAGVTIDRTKDGFSITGRQKYEAISHGNVEGDWSAAAFWLVAGVTGKSPVICTGIDTERSLQGDKAIVGILRSMGAEIRTNGDTVTAFPSTLNGIGIDCSDIPDLVPALTVAAACAKGQTVFRNVSRLHLKESDRIATISAMLDSFGIKAEADADTLSVTGGQPHSCSIGTAGDHRIAMAASIMAVLCSEPVTISGAECVSKSYPSFYNDFIKLGGHIG